MPNLTGAEFDQLVPRLSCAEFDRCRVVQHSLGIIFNYNNKFTNAEKKLSEQAREALFALKKNISDMSFNNETLLSLFDCYIGGIFSYASEIWGTHKGNNIEKPHLEFCKQMLGVKYPWLYMMNWTESH